MIRTVEVLCELDILYTHTRHCSQVPDLRARLQTPPSVSSAERSVYNLAIKHPLFLTKLMTHSLTPHSHYLAYRGKQTCIRNVSPVSTRTNLSATTPPPLTAISFYTHDPPPVRARTAASA